VQTLPSLKQLQYLTALADYASFSEAAAACNVTQSTLSAGIATLETLLGQKLADRSQRRIALTPFGEETVERARALVAGAGDLVTRARSLSAPLTGPLRVGIIPTIAPYLLPRILPALQKKFPALELQWREDLSHRLVEMLRLGQLDLILMAFPFDTPGMEQMTLFDEPFVLACPKNHWHGPRPLKSAALEGEKLLLLEEGHCLRDHALAACKLQPRRERQAFNATSLATLVQMVGQGYGLTLLPAMAAHKDSLPDTVEIIPFRAPAPSRTIGLAWRTGSPRAKDFGVLGQTLTQCP
jgi:LysR family hydrogen peroxide-inducible transcriptional activator